MHSKAQSHSSIFGVSWNAASTAFTIALTLLFLIFIVLFITLTAQSAQGQTYTVIYNFSDGLDGCCIFAGLTTDQNGTFYGTAAQGGANGDGLVFSLKQGISGWVETPLYNFVFGNDGAAPESPVVFGPDGTLYGTTKYGGGGTCPYGCGTVYNLKPPAAGCFTGSCSWTETQLYSFPSQSDGMWPSGGADVFDSAGDLYGTILGGTYGVGQLYKLAHSDGRWAKSDSYNFTSNEIGPNAVVFDTMGNLYGTTSGGGVGYGTVFRLTRSEAVGWVEDELYAFQNGDDGWSPSAGVILDSLGNIYGSTACSGRTGSGAVFMLSPASGNWTFTVLYAFGPPYCGGPYASLTMDAAGNLYGTTSLSGIYEHGSVFKLTPSTSGWIYTSLHDFTGGSDGNEPQGSLVFDSAGNLYGTTETGGAYGWGTIFEITP